MSLNAVISEWTSGNSKYYRLTHEGKPYAVLVGATLQDQDKVFAIRTDPSSQNVFFTNLATKAKSWELPDLLAASPVPNTKSASNALTFKQRAEAMYNKYCPSKVQQVDKLLSQYAGQEEACIAALVKKYGPEPSGSGDGNSTSTTSLSTNKTGAPATSNTNTSSNGSDYAARVNRFYEVYCPSKLSNASKQLEKYKGQESLLIDALIAKYGPEPSADAAASPASPASPPSPPPTPSSVPSTTQGRGAESETQRSTETGEGSLPAAGPKEDTDESSTAAAAERPTEPPIIVPKHSFAGVAKTVMHTIQSPSRSSAGSSVSITEAENRERVLTGFIRDREQRLAEAQARYDTAMESLESLRKTNSDLIHEMDALRRETDQQVSSTRLAMDRLREDSQIARNEWHREKQQLQSAVDEAAANSQKLLQAERLRLEEEIVKFIGEKAQLQSELHSAKRQLDEQLNRSSDMIAVLDKQEKEHERLLRVIDSLNLRIEGAPKAQRATQTDDSLLGMVTKAESMTVSSSPPANGPGPDTVAYLGSDAASRSVSTARNNNNSGGHVDATMAAIEEFDRVMATEKYRRNELEQWKSHCARLEQELREARDTSFASVGKRGGPSPCDCASKLKSLRATIGALRSCNRALEEKIAELELRLIAQPPQDREGGPLAVDGEATLRLRETVVALKEQLSEAADQSKAQKREIQELRARLVGLMSSPTPSRRSGGYF